MRTMHLFAGAGGGLLADLILGHTPVVAVEWVPYACQVLRERAADGWFPGLHVHEGDVRLYDPSDYAGSVDCIHAGFPCQDISVAGNQAGVGLETRSGLYREVLRIAGIVRPRYLFLENVAAIVSNGLDTVLADLTALGYDSEWLCLRASDCGAPHQRDRWWLLATMADTERTPSQQRSESYMQRGWTDEAEQTGLGGCDVANASSGRCSGQEIWKVEQPWRAEVIGASEDVADTNGMRQPQPKGTECDERGRTGDGGEELADSSSVNAQRKQSVSIDTKGWQGQAQRPFGSRNHGGFWWQVEPDVGRVVDGVASRVDRLKALGNGQVPLQAALAWKLLGGE